ncbi:MAG: 4-alpha-glucanotransferase, partial [Treponema sp.]|nr:4-alpha-glucanotransferase [Treponema sp.]
MNKKTGVTVPLSALYTKECSPIGDFPALKDFADFCVKSGIQVIQLLPVNDTG